MDRVKVINNAIENLEAAVAAIVEKYGEPMLEQAPVQQTSVQTEPSKSQVYSTSSAARPQSAVASNQARGSYSNAVPAKRSSFKDLIGLGRGRRTDRNNLTRQRQ